jgi:DNA polymerase-4
MFPTGKRGTMRGGGDAAGPPGRLILHVDMDAFYAQVEQLLKPRLRGRPVIVGLGASRRSVVTACSYEARAFGIKAGMPRFQALKLCPQAIAVKGSMDSYTYFSEKVREIFNEFTPIVEPASIDEAFLDVTGCMALYSDAASLAASLKREVKSRLGLTCSVGISDNKHLAKVASALEKPDGLTTIWPHELREKLFPLEVSRLYGVGPVTACTMNRLGLHSIGELAEAPLSLLNKHFGSSGEHFKRIANGQDDSPVRRVADMSSEKSMSHSCTFEHDSADIEYLHSVILHLSDKVVSRMKVRGFLARTVSLQVRFADFNTITRDNSLQIPTDNLEMIYSVARTLLPADRVRRKQVRLLGVRVSNLSKADAAGQIALFENPTMEKQHRAADAVESIRRKFGKKSIVRAGSLRFTGRGNRQTLPPKEHVGDSPLDID